jgi:hypothetical protein
MINLRHLQTNFNRDFIVLPTSKKLTKIRWENDWCTLNLGNFLEKLFMSKVLITRKNFSVIYVQNSKSWGDKAICAYDINL